MLWKKKPVETVHEDAEFLDLEPQALDTDLPEMEVAELSEADELAAAEETEFQRIKSAIHQKVISQIDLSLIGTMNEDDLSLEIRRTAEVNLRELAKPLSLEDRERLVDEVINETFGLGPLESILADPDVSDILINGSDTVYIERKGRLEKTRITFANDEHLLKIIQRIVSAIGRRIDETSPMVDARLADGSRVNAIIPPLALDGPLVSIRRFGARPLGAGDLLANCSATAWV